MAHEPDGKKQAMDLAEASRETEWQFPSFVAELFKGHFRWDLLHPYPAQDDADRAIGDAYIEKVRAVLEEHVNPEEVDRTATIPEAAVEALAGIGAFGLKIPEEYGGVGLSQTNYNRVMAYIASYCASTAVLLSAHQSIGVPQPLKLFGTEEQKKRWLPRFAEGAVSAFALTEPGVGSDPARMTTTATPSEDGRYYTLNGEKLWCTNGPMADILVVMAVTPPKIVNGKEKKQITAFIVESDAPGFEVVHRCDFMGIRGIVNGLLRFNDVKVPAENIIGQPGQGLKIALTTLNTGRLTMPATATGSGKLAMHFSKDWANERVQWGVPVSKHQAVASKLANMAAETFAMESVSEVACRMVDRGGADIRLEAAMAKYYCTETAWSLLDDFVQVRGGRGFETAESLRGRGELPIPAERMLRDARIARIIEGTSEIMQLFIAREAMDVHVRFAMPLMMDTEKSLWQKRGLLMQALAFYARWYPRMWMPVGGDLGLRHLSRANRAHLAWASRTARRLARTLFHTMARFGPKLEREQLVMGCFVDIGTNLFVMTATLARAEAILADQPDDDLQALVDHYCAMARERIGHSFRRARVSQRKMTRVAKAFREGRYDWLTHGVYRDVPPLCRQAGPQPPGEAAPAPAPQAPPETEESAAREKATT